MAGKPLDEVIMLPDNWAELKFSFLISQPNTYVVGAQKNHIFETVLLGTKNKC